MRVVFVKSKKSILVYNNVLHISYKYITFAGKTNKNSLHFEY